MKFKSASFAVLAFSALATASSQGALIITGIIDGGLSGGLPKAIELYATTDIADLSVYTVDSATNGGTFDAGTVITLSGSVTVGQYLYVASESTGFNTYFGFDPDFSGSPMNVNGNDVVGLFLSGTLVDVYGVLGVDGSGETWDYLDGYAYRTDGTGPSATFTASDWTFSGINTTDGTSTAPAGFAIGTYSVPEPSAALLGAIGILGLLRRRRV